MREKRDVQFSTDVFPRAKRHRVFTDCRAVSPQTEIGTLVPEQGNERKRGASGQFRLGGFTPLHKRRGRFLEEWEIADDIDFFCRRGICAFGTDGWSIKNR